MKIENKTQDDIIIYYTEDSKRIALAPDESVQVNDEELKDRVDIVVSENIKEVSKVRAMLSTLLGFVVSVPLALLDAFELESVCKSLQFTVKGNINREKYDFSDCVITVLESKENLKKYALAINGVKIPTEPFYTVAEFEKEMKNYNQSFAMPFCLPLLFFAVVGICLLFNYTFGSIICFAIVAFIAALANRVYTKMNKHLIDQIKSKCLDNFKNTE